MRFREQRDCPESRVPKRKGSANAEPGAFSENPLSKVPGFPDSCQRCGEFAALQLNAGSQEKSLHSSPRFRRVLKMGAEAKGLPR
jgi:hypothetical protein